MLIPKIIHNIWIQGYNELPEKNKKNHIEIKKLNPDWDFIIWDNTMILHLLKKYPKLLHLYKNPDKLSGVIHSRATQSDIARCVILKEYGGLYYDLDFECISSLNDLFHNRDKQFTNINTVYIASSKIEFLDYIWPFDFYKPNYCSCFMAFRKNHPIWKKVFQSFENTTSKYVIGHALDKTLQENNYNVVVLERVNGHYSCSNKDHICFTPVESSWNPVRPIMKFINCYYKQVFLFLLAIIVIIVVEKINHHNIMMFGLTTFIPGQTQVQQMQVNPEKKSKKSKK